MSGQFHTSAALPPGEGIPSTHQVGGWMGPRAGLDAMARRKIPSHCRESIAGLQLIA